jgi:hypothetical protein
MKWIVGIVAAFAVLMLAGCTPKQQDKAAEVIAPVVSQIPEKGPVAAVAKGVEVAGKGIEKTKEKAIDTAAEGVVEAGKAAKETTADAQKEAAKMVDKATGKGK